MDQVFFSSVARIADLERRPFDVQPMPRNDWRNGDYVLARVDRPPQGFALIELTNGRMVRMSEGDGVVGALGVRCATLEAVGSWEAVEDDYRFQALTSAGLFGRVTSKSLLLPPMLGLRYQGHVVRADAPVRMSDFAVPDTATEPFSIPTVLIVGTSMSSGKTASAKVIVRELKRMGRRVAGAKLSGAGRYRDVLGMQDAGADVIADFVDVGLPSTALPKEEYRPLLRRLLAHITAGHPDVLVAEAGASPLEPYNGDTVLEELGEQVCCMVLCASDPYAVAGVIQGFRRDPDIVAGIATNTSAGIDLIEKLTGMHGLNLLDPDSRPALRKALDRALGGT